MADTSYDHKINVVVTGDSNVGVTSILNKLTNYQIKKHPKFDINLASRRLIVNNADVLLEVFNTDFMYKKNKHLYTYVAAVIIVFDVTNKESFKNVTKHLLNIRSATYNAPLIMLIGNKIDLVEQRKVRYIDAFQYARVEGLMYAETNALVSVDAPFIELVTNVLKTLSCNHIKLQLELKQDLDLDLDHKYYINDKPTVIKLFVAGSLGYICCFLGNYNLTYALLSVWFCIAIFIFYLLTKIKKN